MQRDLGSYLCDIDEAGSNILTFTKNKNFAQYVADVQARLAVERCFEIIGEALKQAEYAFPEVTSLFPDIRDIIGLRNNLIHEYTKINDSKVWQVVRQNLPQLLETVRTKLESLESHE